MHQDKIAGDLSARYVVRGEIAAGGMATVHLGELHGPGGFVRAVAIKRLHPQFAKDPDFVTMFLDEARLAARIHHPNVVSHLSVVSRPEGLLLVMEYVHGDSLAHLIRAGGPIAPAIVIGIVLGVLHGLHAAHEATDDRGRPLGMVHRDVSPHNIQVGVDGVARLLDFGIAKAISSTQRTREGELKGKLAYMSPEQIAANKLDRRTDIYSAAVVLWEALAGRALFGANNPGAIVQQIASGQIVPPSRYAPSVPHALDAVVLRGLSRNADERFPTARSMADALVRAGQPALPHEIGAWVERTAVETLATRARLLAGNVQQPALTDSEAPTVVTGLESLLASDELGVIPAEGGIRLDRPANNAASADYVLALGAPGRGAPTPSTPVKRWAPRALSLGAITALALISLGVLAVLLRARMNAAATREAAASTIPLASAPVDTIPVAATSTATATALTGSTPDEPAPNAPAVASAATAAPRARSTAPVPKPNCFPAFFTDEDGVRHYKRGCL